MSSIKLLVLYITQSVSDVVLKISKSTFQLVHREHHKEVTFQSVFKKSNENIQFSNRGIWTRRRAWWY